MYGNNSQHPTNYKQNTDEEKPKPMFIITESMLSTILRVQFNQICEYVSTRNILFQQIQSHSSTSKKIEHEQLQSIVILSYKIKFIELIQSLWITYQKSGVDNLQIIPEIQNIDRKVWPKEFLLLADESQTLLVETSTNEHSPSSSVQKPRKHHFYLSFTDSCLFTLQKKREKFHHILTNEIQHLPDYNDQLQQQINVSIQQDLLPIQIEINCHIELIHYAYKDEIYRRQYLSEIHNEEQIALIEQLYQLKYEQEQLKSEINLLKYMKSIHLSQYSLENSPLIHCIRYPNLHQELYQQYKIFIEKTNSNVFDHYIKSLQIRQRGTQIQFNQVTDTFWHINKTLPNKHHLTQTTHDAINQRLSNITDHLACIYKYKRRLLEI